MLWYSNCPAGRAPWWRFSAVGGSCSGLRFAGIHGRISACTRGLIPFPGWRSWRSYSASNSIDYWTVMRFFGSRGLAAAPDAWKPGFFAQPAVYLFDLLSIRNFFGDSVRAGRSFAALVFWATARGWQLPNVSDTEGSERAGQHDYS